MAGAFPAVKATACHFEVAGAVYGFFRSDQAFFQRGHGRHHLEGRAGRIGALHRLVHQRAIFGIEQRVVVRRRDAADKEVGIVAGGRGNRREIAAFTVDHDDSGAFPIEPGLHVTLQMRIHCQLQVRTRLAFAARKLPHHPARGVHLHLLGTGRPAQHGFFAGLDIDLADLEARDAKNLIRVFERIEIRLAHPAHTTDDMGEILTAGIDTRQAHLRRDAGQGGGVDGDAAHIVP